MAAGVDTRLGKLVERVPKCLLRVSKLSILERQVNILNWCGVEDIKVVIGAQGPCWNDETVNEVRKIAPDIVVNHDNLNTKNSYSLWLAVKDLDRESVLAIDGDIVFNKEVIESLIKSKYETVLLSRTTFNSSEPRGNIILSMDNRVKDIGMPETFPLHIYSGIMKIGNDTLDDFKKVVCFKSKDILDCIRLVCKKKKIYNITFEEISNKEEPSYLIGGSYANLRRITVVRKEINRKERSKKLSNEIRWLLKLPSDLKPYFPKVLNYEIRSSRVFYEMPYYGIPSLRHLLFEREFDADKALELLGEVMGFMFKRIYSRNQRKGGEGWVRKLHLKRIEMRLLETKRKSKILSNIIEAKKIVLNGQTYENIPILLSKIIFRPQLVRNLEPPIICMIHGDLHFQNILVAINKTNKYKFILTDPRGELLGSDPIYDLGKIWHSCHGLYDFLHEDLFELNVDISNGESVRAQLKIKKLPALEEYNRIFRGIPPLIKDYPMIQEDKDWLMRTFFSEAAHFCSVMPFHLKFDGQEKRAISLYLTGVKLINEFASKFRIRQWKEEISWLNINTIEDFLRAKKIWT